MPQLAYDRAGPSTASRHRVVVLHAGVADRRMWEPIWPGLTAEHDVIRVDLRGFGESVDRPAGLLDPVADVTATLDALDVAHCHLVGASYGAGVAVEVALTRPTLVRSLLLAAPGGALIGEVTPDLRASWDAERAAMTAGDLDAAVEANLRAWVDGPRRPAAAGDRATRDLVATMQRRAFELTADWDDVQEAELDPPALERLAEIAVPTLVLLGTEDIDAIRLAADQLERDVAGVRRVDWDGVAHLPPLERPDAFLELLLSFVP